MKDAPAVLIVAQSNIASFTPRVGAGEVFSVCTCVLLGVLTHPDIGSQLQAHIACALVFALEAASDMLGSRSRRKWFNVHIVPPPSDTVSSSFDDCLLEIVLLRGTSWPPFFATRNHSKARSKKNWECVVVGWKNRYRMKAFVMAMSIRPQNSRQSLRFDTNLQGRSCDECVVCCIHLQV